MARVYNPDRGIHVADAVLHLPGQTWVPLGGELTVASWRLAAQCRLRGADAIYGAVAERYSAALVTLDRQQLEQLTPRLPVWTPDEALRRLALQT